MYKTLLHTNDTCLVKILILQSKHSSLGKILKIHNKSILINATLNDTNIIAPLYIE